MDFRHVVHVVVCIRGGITVRATLSDRSRRWSFYIQEYMHGPSPGLEPTDEVASLTIRAASAHVQRSLSLCQVWVHWDVAGCGCRAPK